MVPPLPWPQELGQEVEGEQLPRTQLPPNAAQKHMAPPVFTPLPILGVRAFKYISDDRLALIEAIKSAATNFSKAHKDSDPKCVCVTETPVGEVICSHAISIALHVPPPPTIDRGLRKKHSLN